MGSRGPEGPSRWPKATSPPQELEVGGRRPPYLLVDDTEVNLILPKNPNFQQHAINHALTKIADYIKSSKLVLNKEKNKLFIVSNDHEMKNSS